MLGIIVQLAISWLIIWIYEKGNLSFLGFYPTKKRILDFILFFLITAFCCSSGFFLRMYFGKEVWNRNESLTTKIALNAIWWNIKSVLFEELIFRGVLFYILIKKLGVPKAIIISSIAFGIYHWFSQEVFGQPVQMAITFLLTGIMGALYAYGYTKSFSLFIPCAIHLGWNLTQGFIFSQGPIGKGMFVLAKEQPVVNVSYLIYFTILLTPILSTWIINFLILKKRKQTVLLP
ncbi:type II CAAX endopeptidase family protein [Lacibacter sp. MH-610]|uniref:CPBP family intramembrane glutamic endopeptidase n=1 Tax=Lacibacter sp. MH-610 TaxID=3020883 RepID=UPI00389280FD